MSGMRFAIVGAGVIGRLRAQALQHVEGATLSVVYDVDAAAAQALAGTHQAEATTDYTHLLTWDDVDVVIVSSPPHYHEAQVLAALEANKHVLCEKPLAPSAAACRRMVETAQQRDRILTTGFNHRYFPAIQYVKETLDSGMIGELDHVRAFAGHPGLSEFRAAWEYDAQVIGGGALMDVGIHMLDLTRFLFGEVEEVYGKATGNVWNLPGAEDNGLVLMKNTAGKYATFQATWSEWKGYRFHIEVYGTHGMARAYYAPMMSMRVVMDKPGGPARRERKFYPQNIVQEKLRGWQWTVIHTFTQELTDFISLTQGGAPSTIADGFSGFRVAEIAQAVYRCTEENQPVVLEAPF